MQHFKEILITAIVSGFGLAYLKWDNFYMGFWNWLFAFLTAFVIQYIFLIIFRFVCKKKYGCQIEINRFSIKKEIKRFDYIRKRLVFKEWRFPLGYFLMLVFIFITNGIFFPVVGYVYDIKTDPIFRLGKSKETVLKIKERYNSLLLSGIALIILVQLFRTVFHGSFFINNLLNYALRFTYLFVISLFIPWNTLLSVPVLSWLNSEFESRCTGEMANFIELEYVAGTFTILAILMILGTFVNPLIALLISLPFGLYIWLRLKYKAIIGE